MRLNSTVLVRAETRSLLEKRGVWEAELQESATQAAAPLLGALQQSAQLRTLLSVYMPQLALTSQAIKAQFNEGLHRCSTEPYCNMLRQTKCRRAFAGQLKSKTAWLDACGLMPGSMLQGREPASQCTSTAMSRCTAAKLTVASLHDSCGSALLLSLRDRSIIKRPSPKAHDWYRWMVGG